MNLPAWMFVLTWITFDDQVRDLGNGTALRFGRGACDVILSNHKIKSTGKD